jgi:hypothetical protein
MATTLPQPNPFAAPLVGTSAIEIAPQNVSRESLFVYNPSAAATIAIAPAGATPAINGANSITLLPQTGMQLDGWTAAVNAIASAPSTPVTVYEFSGV